MGDVLFQDLDQRAEEGAVLFGRRGSGQGAHLVLDEAVESGGIGGIGDGVGVVVLGLGLGLGGGGFGEDVVKVGDEGGHVDLPASAGCGGGGLDVVLDCGLVSMEVEMS